MSDGTEDYPDTRSPDDPGISRNAVIRLLVIPILIYAIWVLELYLFAGAVHLFAYPSGAGLLLYTLVVCILVGLVIPVFLIRRAFLTGAVNMFQLGFRSLRRTLAAAALAALLICVAVLATVQPGPDRTFFAQCFLLLLPTGIAAVMVCWVMIGTHIQALIRHGGALITIPVGIVTTGILFGLALFVLVPVQRSPDLVAQCIGTGMLIAFFFFAVRDISATVILVTGSMVFLLSGSISPAPISQTMPWVYSAAIATVVCLCGIYWYLSRHFVTIQIPVP